MSGVARPSRGRVAQRQESCAFRYPIRKETSFLVVRRGTDLLCLTAPDRKPVGPPGVRMPEFLAAHTGSKPGDYLAQRVSLDIIMSVGLVKSMPFARE